MLGKHFYLFASTPSLLLPFEDCLLAAIIFALLLGRYDIVDDGREWTLES